jgi:ABC-2 type transport system permease protein
MSLRRLISVLNKEYRHILREPRTLWMVFLSPALVLIALSTVFASGGGRINLAVWDQDRTPLARRFGATLGSDEDFRLEYASDYAEIEQLLETQAIDAAPVIPPGFEDTIQAGETAPVQVILDGIDTYVAGQATGSLLGHAADFGAAISRGTQHAQPPLQVQPQAAYLPNATERDSMVPGLIPIVFSLPVMAAALALTKERESGSLESLVATPVRGTEYLLGKLIAYVSASLGGLLPVWLTATVLFSVPFNGNPLLLVLMTVVFLLSSVGLALFVGSLVQSQRAATIIALFIFFVPGFFLAGLIDPIDTTDLLSTAFSYALPSTHFVTIARALFIKGAGLGDLWRPVLMLLAQAAVWIGVGVLRFKKRVS